MRSVHLPPLLLLAACLPLCVPAGSYGQGSADALSDRENLPVRTKAPVQPLASKSQVAAAWAKATGNGLEPLPETPTGYRHHWLFSGAAQTFFDQQPAKPATLSTAPAPLPLLRNGAAYAQQKAWFHGRQPSDWFSCPSQRSLIPVGRSMSFSPKYDYQHFADCLKH